MTKPLEKKGLKALAFWDNGMKVFSIRGSKPLLNAPADFKGKKFRIQSSDVHDAMITPPVGLNLYVAAGLSGMSLAEVTKAALPWMGVLIVALLFITYIPWLSLFLVSVLF
jgi:phosphoglycerol transferase MdoB-like AlkP superfamily enzyme